MAQPESSDNGQETTETMSSGPGQTLAIGFYIGTIILIIGLMLVVYGAVGPAPPRQHGLNFNKDLWWGLLMVLVGVVTLGLSYASPRRRATARARQTGDASGA